MADKFEMFVNRLTKVFKHRSKLAKKQGITCYRVYDLDMPEFPFCIEIYESKIYVAEYRRNHHMSEEDHRDWLRYSKFNIAQVLGCDVSDIFLRQRKVIDNRQQQYQKKELDEQWMLVSEAGLKFYINLNTYLDSGLFLDHRITRKMIGEKSQGKQVLNLFAYTGSFSVYAAAHGAQCVTTVDLSNTYMDWCKKNFIANNLNLASHKFITTDVLQWLPSQKEKQYDLIICDPPTFSNSKKMEDTLDTQRDHGSMIKHCMRLLRPEGILVFSTNYSKFKLDTDSLQNYTIKDIKAMTTPFDFEGKLDRYCFIISHNK